jgi:hypothetical protein
MDILIPDILGILPRDDDLLVIDPLVPETALGFFILDGLRYHGRDVSIVWDEPRAGSPDRYADGKKGLDLYVGGKLVASSPRLARLCVDLTTGRSLPIGEGTALPAR